MKNTALCDLIATSENSCSSFRLATIANPLKNASSKAEKVRCCSGSCSLCGASLHGLHPTSLFLPQTVTFITFDRRVNPDAIFLP
jgi:hypothetical protein